MIARPFEWLALDRLEQRWRDSPDDAPPAPPASSANRPAPSADPLAPSVAPANSAALAPSTAPATATAAAPATTTAAAPATAATAATASDADVLAWCARLRELGRERYGAGTAIARVIDELCRLAAARFAGDGAAPLDPAAAAELDARIADYVRHVEDLADAVSLGARR
jgi:hypothetical protein